MCQYNLSVVQKYKDNAKDLDIDTDVLANL